jgi:hypothetical protein
MVCPSDLRPGQVNMTQTMLHRSMNAAMHQNEGRNYLKDREI